MTGSSSELYLRRPKVWSLHVARQGTTFFRLIPSSLRLASMVLAIAGLFSQAVTAQQMRGLAVEGYITAVYSPTSFGVNQVRVNLRPETTFGLIGEKATQTGGSLLDAVQVGTYVQVVGKVKGKPKIATANSVFVDDSWNNKLSGTGVIDKVISPWPEPVYQADGYRVRITSATEIEFAEGLKTLADVGTNNWLRYEGKRDKDGVLVAAKAKFIPGKPTKVRAIPGFEVNTLKVLPVDPERNPGGFPISLNSAGTLSVKDKVKIGTFARWHAVEDDKSLQERVQRVGMRLIPEYQRQMADDNPSKIHFGFYAIDDKKSRWAKVTLEGLILVPKPVVERLNNDDQLAAILADGVAFDLQRQLARLVADSRMLLGAAALSGVADVFIPGVSLISYVGADAAAGKIVRDTLAERARVALSLLADAGYDPWQAPEAWRLMAPKHLPGDTDSLPYGCYAGYQLSILSLQYKAKMTHQAGNPAPITAQPDQR